MNVLVVEDGVGLNQCIRKGLQSEGIDMNINYLRRQIDYPEPKLLHTVFGVGYVLRAEP